LRPYSTPKFILRNGSLYKKAYKPPKLDGKPDFTPEFSRLQYQTRNEIKTFLIGVIIIEAAKGDRFGLHKVSKQIIKLCHRQHINLYKRILSNDRNGFAPVHFFFFADVLGVEWLEILRRGKEFVSLVGLDLDSKITVTQVKRLYKELKQV